MKRAVLLFVVLALCAGQAVAGQNPDIRIFLNASSAGTGNNWTTSPAEGTNKSVYVCFDNFGPGGGMYAGQFHMLPVGGPNYLSTTNQFAASHGGLTIGEAVVPPGASMTVGPLPQYPGASGIIVLARVRFETPEPMRDGGYIMLVTYSAGDGNVVADANNQLDVWCIKSIANGGVSGHFYWDTEPVGFPDGTCIETPVETQSWGAIKALYR
ncbi:MAG: hypothetical protein FJY74_03205 [Candidatus Eisenbacteria bacterium]|nr:hypothetical protein [Candidatus Eisenbacteria bacterium]